ncbi:MAG: (d)CMP kinase [Pseudarthrobacter sp.]
MGWMSFPAGSDQPPPVNPGDIDDRRSGMAAVLAPKSCLIVAVDGGAASGKTTICTALARGLDFPYFNTGLIFRGLTLSCLTHLRNVENEDDVASELESADLQVEIHDLSTRIILSGVDVTEELMSAIVTESVSAVASHSRIREEMTRIQRAVAKRICAEADGVVVDGRDATSVVWPDARFRFLMVPDDGEQVRVGEDVASRNHADSKVAEFSAPARGVIPLRTTRANLQQVGQQILDLIWSSEEPG